MALLADIFTLLGPPIEMDDNVEDPRPLKRVKVGESQATLQDNPKSGSYSSDNKKELEVGIHTWIDESRPVFHALLKKRYTDFLVNEILLDGTVAHLRDLRPKRSHDEMTIHSTTTVDAPGGDDEINHEASGRDKAIQSSTGVSASEAPSVSGLGNPVFQSEEQSQSEGTEVSSPFIYHFLLTYISRFPKRTEPN